MMGAWQVLLFLVCVWVATVAQSLTGFALALVLLGLVGALKVVPVADAVNVATVLSLANACVSLRGSRATLDRRMLRSTLSGTVIGIAAGVVLLTWLSAIVVELLQLLLGVVVIAAAAMVLRRTEPLPRRSSDRAFRNTGLLSGLLGGMFSAPGPPLVYQLYRQPMPLPAVRQTLIALLAVGATLRLLMVIPTGQFSARALGLSVLAAPVAVGTTWWIRQHPPDWPRMRVLQLVCALLVATGLGLIVPALRGLVSP